MRTDGDPDVLRKGLEMLAGFRERVLDNAGPLQGKTLLDVGCGEGLIAFGALERGAGAVVFSDISRDLLDFCREAAEELGVSERCRFVGASADDLAGVEDESVDVVTTRSVLIYVSDKGASLREFARVLRPGGRISLFEPINRFAQQSGGFWAGFDLGAIPEIAGKMRAFYEAIQPPDTDPMTDFDERDLIRCAEEAGFHPIHLQLEAEIRPSEPMPWESFLNRAGNPRIPPIGEVMNEALMASEREQLVEHLRPLVERGGGTWRMASAFLYAVKP
jgi:ubiquinone/menaquinone biosynthesis C-methylase UbiE